MSPTNFDVYPILTLFFKSHSPQRKGLLPYSTPFPNTPSAEWLKGTTAVVVQVPQVLAGTCRHFSCPFLSHTSRSVSKNCVIDLRGQNDLKQPLTWLPGKVWFLRRAAQLQTVPNLRCIVNLIL